MPEVQFTTFDRLSCVTCCRVLQSIIHYQPSACTASVSLCAFFAVWPRENKDESEKRRRGRVEDAPFRAHQKYGNRPFTTENSMETLVSQAKFTQCGNDHSVGRKPHFQAEFQKNGKKFWNNVVVQIHCSLALYLASRLALSLIISAPAKRHNDR